MVPVMDFADWLAGELERQNVSRRELGRRLAAQYPGAGGEDAEDSQQRKLRKILSRKASPRQSTRDSICDALGVPRDSARAEGDENSPITREMVVEELRRIRRNALRLERALLGEGIVSC